MYMTCTQSAGKGTSTLLQGPVYDYEEKFSGKRVTLSQVNFYLRIKKLEKEVNSFARANSTRA